MSGVWLVLPTYNEAENVEPIVEAALPRLCEASAIAGGSGGHHLLIVDDSSPDGTGRIADARKHLKPPVRSRTGTRRMLRAYQEPPRERRRRRRPQSATPPPAT